MASPTPPNKVITFADFQAAQPSTPLPAVSLDSQIAEVIRSCTEIIDALALIQRSDGELQNQIVKDPQLALDLVATLTANLQSQVTPIQTQLDSIQTTLDTITASAQAAATQAGLDAASAQTARNASQTAQAGAEQAETDAQSHALDAEANAQAAAQSLVSFQQAEARAEFYENSAYLWAEFMGGPVVDLPATPNVYPAAVDDGLWSAKWWAVTASNYADAAQALVDEFRSLYWVTWNQTSPPPGQPDDNTGNPQNGPNGELPLPGTFYLHFPSNQLRVYTGSTWLPFGAAGNQTVYVSDTAPTNPRSGEFWLNSSNGTLYVWYIDSDSAQWMGVSAGNLDLRAVQSYSTTVTINARDHLNGSLQLDSPTPIDAFIDINPPVEPNFKIGQYVKITQRGAGLAQFTKGVGVTFLSPASVACAAQYSTIEAQYVGDDTWVISGDLAP